MFFIAPLWNVFQRIFMYLFLFNCLLVSITTNKKKLDEPNNHCKKPNKFIVTCSTWRKYSKLTLLLFKYPISSLPPINKASWRSGMKWPVECSGLIIFISLLSISYSHQTPTNTFKHAYFSYQRWLYKSHKWHLLSFLYTRNASHSAVQRRAAPAERPRVECDCVAPVYSVALCIPPHLPTNPPVKKLNFCLSEGQGVLNGRSVDDRLQLPVPESGAEFKAVQVFFFSALAALAVSPDSLTGCVWTRCSCDCETWDF